jgi:AraC-like DNA-binding protein
MNAFHNSLYAVALVSFMLLLILLRREGPREPQGRNRFLFALLLLLALNFSFEWLMSNPAAPAKSLWLALVMGLAFFLGPCLWLHARAVTENPVPRVRDFPAAHLVPICLGLLLLLPLLSSVHLGTDFSSPAHNAGQPPPPIHGTMLGAILIFAVQSGFYLRESYRILARQSVAPGVLLPDGGDRRLVTLRLLMLVVGAHWVVGIARTLHCLILGKDAGFIVLFAIAEVLIVLAAAITLLRQYPQAASEGRSASVDGVAVKYAKSALDAPARARIARKLLEGWNSQGLHRNGGLTLRSVCEQIRESPHYVSQVISQDLGTSFFDLVNQQRVRDAMDALLADQDRPVIDIALGVGFNAKSTFNSAFRQFTGMTPSEFRRARVREHAQSSGPAAIN